MLLEFQSYLSHITVRNFFLNKELLSTQKMRLPQKRAHQDDSNDTVIRIVLIGQCSWYVALLFRLTKVGYFEKL